MRPVVRIHSGAWTIRICVAIRGPLVRQQHYNLQQFGRTAPARNTGDGGGVDLTARRQVRDHTSVSLQWRAMCHALSQANLRMHQVEEEQMTMMKRVAAACAVVFALTSPAAAQQADTANTARSAPATIMTQPAPAHMLTLPEV